MKPMKAIILSTLIIATAAIGATAYANRSAERYQGQIIEKITKRLDLNDTQSLALTGLTEKLKETRDLMKGDRDNVHAEMISLVSTNTFDQGKALSMINDRAAALQNNAPELVAAAAVFFDSLDSSQKEKINKLAEKLRKRHPH